MHSLHSWFAMHFALLHLWIQIRYKMMKNFYCSILHFLLTLVVSLEGDQIFWIIPMLVKKNKNSGSGDVIHSGVISFIFCFSTRNNHIWCTNSVFPYCSSHAIQILHSRCICWIITKWLRSIPCKVYAFP